MEMEGPLSGETTLAPSPEDGRRHFREQYSGPQLLSAQIILKDPSGNKKEFNLKIDNSTRNGLGLLITTSEKELLEWVNIGDTLEDVVFYAGWAMLKVNALVKHKTLVPGTAGKNETYIMGVASDDLI